MSVGGNEDECKISRRMRKRRRRVKKMGRARTTRKGITGVYK